MFWSKLFKSNWSCAWNLGFPVFISPIVWNMCENLHYESVYCKELLRDQEYCWPTRAGGAAARSPALHVCVNPPLTQASPAPVSQGRLQPHIWTTAVLVIHKGKIIFFHQELIHWMAACLNTITVSWFWHLIPIKLGEIEGDTAVNNMFNSVFLAGIKT